MVLSHRSRIDRTHRVMACSVLVALALVVPAFAEPVDDVKRSQIRIRSTAEYDPFEEAMPAAPQAPSAAEHEKPPLSPADYRHFISTVQRQVQPARPIAKPEPVTRRMATSAKSITQVIHAPATRAPRLALQPPEGPSAAAEDSRIDRCAAILGAPLSKVTINIALPSEDVPENIANACWQEINSAAGPLAAARAWPTLVYTWNATCLCHRPLYFEEINLERHGYGCHGCLQVGVSAAHFFATVPALPYCMAVDCPGECDYTLGHYRPGSCPPWRHHWPPCEPLAAASAGGIWTGMIFLIP